MIIGIEDKKIIANILKRHIESNNITAYQLNKLKIISNKTLKKLIDANSGNISVDTIEKLYKKLDFDCKNKKIIEVILNKYKHNIKKESENRFKNQKIDIDILLKLNSDKIIKEIIDIKKTIENNFIKIPDKIIKQETTYEKNDYISKRKINSFYSDFDTRTLLITKIWELNDTVFDKWKEVELLLGIGDAKDIKKIKKGLLTVAKNLRDIAQQLENAGINSKSTDDEVIIIKGE